MEALVVGAKVVASWLAKEGDKKILLQIASAVVISAVSQALNKPKTGPASGVQQQRQFGTNVLREIVVGETIVAGSEVALWGSGNNDPAGANVTNTRVVAVSDWPTDLIEIIWRGQPLTFEGNISNGWFACNQFVGKKGRKRLFGRFYRGDWDQAADSTLMGKAVAGSSWGSDDRLRGCAYFALYRIYDPDAFPQGAPDMGDLRFRVRARHIYDWRDPSQSLSDARTWKPCNNPVVISEFLLCHARAPGQFSPGDTSALVGPGLDWAARFAALGPALTAGANVCDELVEGKPRYTCGGVASGPASNWLGKLAAACGGEWVQTAAGSYLWPGYLSAPVMALPVAALSRSEADVFDPWLPPDNAINTVKGQYPEPANGWEIADVSAVDGPSRAQDGMDLVETLDLSWVSDRAQANRIAAARAKLESAREQRTVTAPFWMQELEYGDVITLDDPTLPTALAGAWWQVRTVGFRASSEGALSELSLRRVPPDAYGAPPPAPALPAWTPPGLDRTLQPPTVTASTISVAGAGSSWREARITVADDSAVLLGLVEFVGPATANTGTAFETANVRPLPLDRAMGGTTTGALVPGWYRWRVAGRTASGASGDWSAWSASIRITDDVTAGEAGSVDYPNIANKPLIGRGPVANRPANPGVVNSEWAETDANDNAVQVWNWTGLSWVLDSTASGRVLPVATLPPSSEALPGTLYQPADDVQDGLWRAPGAGVLVPVNVAVQPTTYPTYTGHTGTGAGLRDGVFVGVASVTATGATESGYIEINLGSVQPIRALCVAPISTSFQGWGPTFINNASISAWNGSTYVQVATVTGCTDGVVTTVPLPPGTATQYILIKTPPSVNYLAVAELYCLGGWERVATVGARVGSNVLPGSGDVPIPSVELLNTEQTPTGLASARPASGAFSGQTYLASDTRVLSRWSGSAWVDGPTRNTITTSASAPASPVNGDIWHDTSVTPPVTRSRIGAGWVVTANLVTNTNHITDGAGLGATALWPSVTGTGRPADNATVGAAWGSNLTGRPGNVAALTGSEPILNSLLSGNIAAAATTALPGNITLAGETLANRWPAEMGADVTATAQREIVPQFPVIEIKQGEAGHTGNRTVTHTARRGSTALTGGTWSLPTISLGAGSATINTSTGLVTISGIVASGAYVVRYTETGAVTRDEAVNVTYVPTPPTAAVQAKAARVTSNNGAAGAGWLTIASVTMTGAPAGVATVDGRLVVTAASGTASYEARLQLDGVTIGIAVAQSVVTGGLLDFSDFGELFQGAAVAAGNRTFTVQMNRTAGTGSISATDTVIDVIAVAT